MDELEQALIRSRLTDDDDDIDQDDNVDNTLSDDDKYLIENSIELIKVVTSYDVINHVILLFRCVQNVYQTYQELLPNMVIL